MPGLRPEHRLRVNARARSGSGCPGSCDHWEGMEQRVGVITLGVADLGRARRFYEALGWTTGAEPDDDIVFQAGGLVFALWAATGSRRTQS